jgi:hypothetical protein
MKKLDISQITADEIKERPNDLDQFEPTYLRKIFGGRIARLMAAAVTAVALLSGCVFDSSGKVPLSQQDATVDARPLDGGPDAGDASVDDGGGPDAADSSLDAGDSGPPVEDCENEGDENADGVADCMAPECDGQQGPANPNPGICELGTETTCGDNYDNDADGLIDCADSDCFNATCDEVCDDGVDNNLDGLIDCEAPECSLFENGEIKCAYNNEYEINCIDGIDNNGNGQTDCADAACAITAACGASVEDCFNDVSDNGNMWTDCEDGTCSLEDVCIENTGFDCTGVPAGSNCPTSMPAPNHTGMCGEEVGLGRVCQPPPGAY